MPAPPDKHKVDTLVWWKSYHSQLPLLADLAREWLCIPMSSSSSERLFSASGNIISNKRTSLDPATAKKLTLVKVNYDLVGSTIQYKLISDEERAEMEKEGEADSETEPTAGPSHSTPRAGGRPKPTITTPRSAPRKRLMKEPATQATQAAKRLKQSRISIGSEDLFMTQQQAHELEVEDEVVSEKEKEKETETETESTSEFSETSTDERNR